MWTVLMYSMMSIVILHIKLQIGHLNSQVAYSYVSPENFFLLDEPSTYLAAVDLNISLLV